jgi:hypothetical protein
LILVSSILIAIIFFFNYCCPEQNQGNDYKKNGDIKSNKNNSKKPVIIQRENPDINAQKDAPNYENEMMLYINNQHSLNNS